jgi:NitT/TauT family transport system substrate-binding protein
MGRETSVLTIAKEPTMTASVSDNGVPAISPPSPSKWGAGRRSFLGAAVSAGAALTLGAAVSSSLAAPPLVASTGSRTKIKFTWNQTALCTSAVPIAVDRGIFDKHGLDVELVNFGGSTDQLLESIGSGHADAGIGMILRWLKPLEQGFDVKLVAGIHGGCSYLVASRGAGITDIPSLRGKRIGITDLASPDKNLYSIILQNHGLDPDRDIEWKQFPDTVLGMAIGKGEIDAYVAGDPQVYYQIKNSDGKLFRVASNATNEFSERTCCVLGLRGSLLRDDREAAARLTSAILEAAHLVYEDPDHAVAVSGRYAPRSATPADLAEMLKSYPYGHQPIGDDFRGQVLLYAQELKRAGVLKSATDPVRYVRRVTADTLT